MNKHTTSDTPLQLCACGCGKEVPKPKFPSWQRKYISGHQPAAHRPLSERFWEKVDIATPEKCWEWQSSTDRKGYGQIKIKSYKRGQSHRIAYELTYGEIPDGLCVLHKCDNPPCCNPNHLFLGTIQENLEDMRQKDRHSRGQRHPGARLTANQIIEIRTKWREKLHTQKELSNMYGVTEKYISRIVRRKSWKHIP